MRRVVLILSLLGTALFAAAFALSLGELSAGRARRRRDSANRG